MAKRPQMLLGLGILIAIDALLVKFFVLDVLEAARAGSGKVSLSMKAVFLAGVIPGAVVLGLVAWKWIPDMQQRAKEKPAFHYLVAVIICIPGVLLVYWLRRELASLGYHGQ